MVDESDLAPKAGVARELKSLMRERLQEVRNTPALSETGYVRMSSLAMLCPREEVLVSAHSLVRTSTTSADLATIFAHGHALHYGFQNHILPALGVLRGQWACLACGYRHGAPEEGKTVLEVAVGRPMGCAKCGGDQFLFEEYSLVNEEFKLTGHSDGFLELDGMDGLGVFEGKSINPRGAWEVRDTPKLDHAIQAHGYMWLTGAKWAKVVYWDKAGQGLGSFIEHTLEYDEDTIEEIKSTLRSIWDGIKDPTKLPQRICEHEGAPRAVECPARTQCFG